MRVLVCPDSFKGTFSAVEVAAALGAGIEEAGGVADLCPAADGGEGTAETVRAAIGGEVRTAAAHDPLGRPIEASFALVEDGTTAVIDTAAASGLPLVAPAERDAEAASTFGTGELIAAVVEAGARRVLLAAGGSATTDGGTGAIEALRERRVWRAERWRRGFGGAARRHLRRNHNKWQLWLRRRCRPCGALRCDDSVRGRGAGLWAAEGRR